jgi:hypothetical protein
VGHLGLAFIYCAIRQFVFGCGGDHCLKRSQLENVSSIRHEFDLT